MFQLKSLVLAVLGVVFAFFACGSLLAQVQPPELEWERNFGREGGERVDSVKQTLDGGYIIVGTTHILPGGNDIYLVKTDQDGNKVWDKILRKELFNYGADVLQARDGNYFIVGGTSPPGLFGGKYGWDIYFVKTDQDGDIVWEKTEERGIYHYTASSILETPEGNLVIVGSTHPPDRNETVVYLLKTDFDGNTIWDQTYEVLNSMQNVGLDLKQTHDGGYIIVGTTIPTTDEFINADVYLIRTNGFGEKVWEKTYDRSLNDSGYAVQETLDNGFIIAGSTHPSSGSPLDMYVIKTDASGETVWEKTYPDILPPYGKIIQRTPNNEYVLVGHDLREGVRTNVFFKLDAQGDILWEKRFGGGTVYIQSLQTTLDRGYITAGAIYTGTSEGANFYLAKFSPEKLPLPPSQVAANLRTERSIGLSWQDNSANETGFILERKLRSLTQEGGAGGADEWQEIATTQENATQYIDPVLPPEHEVTYRIAAVNNNGTSARISSQPIPTPTPSPEKPWQLKIYIQSDPDNPSTGKWENLIPGDGQFKPEWGTAVIVHGFQIPPFFALNSWVKDIARAIHSRREDVNIIAWDWQKDASIKLIEQSNRVPVSGQIESLNKALKQVISPGYNKPLHFMGHSLGSYIVARVCRKFLGLNPKDPKEFPQVQVTLFDSSDVGLLYDLTSEINLLRTNNIYTDLYHGIFSQGTHNVSVWVNVPGVIGCAITDPLCHFTYNWYLDTIPKGKSPRLLENVNYLFCSGDNITGHIGFGASVLIAPEGDPNANRIRGRCENNGTLKFSKLSICSLLVPGKLFELENPTECPQAQNPTQENTSDLTNGTFSFSEDGRTFNQGCFLCNANTTEFILNTGRRGQGGGGGIEELTARYTLELNIEPEWDYLGFEYDFLSAPAPAELEALIIEGENTYPVFLINSEVTFNESYLDTGLKDIRFLHGRSIRLQIDLRSALPDAIVSIRNLTFWKDQWNGNNPPMAHAGEDQKAHVNCNEFAEITLDGSLTNDPDEGDILQYWWMADGGIIASGVQPTIRLFAGKYTITLVVRDRAEDVSSDEIVITVDTEPCPFVRGDSNNNRQVDISDPINTLGFLFTGQGTVTCQDAADSNDDGGLDISDPIDTLGFLFLGTRPILPPPYPDSGSDPTDDELSCDRY